MRHLVPILSLLLALTACDVEPAADRSSDTSLAADAAADVVLADAANPAACPAAEPAPNGACTGTDTCSYGQECCCGQCSASFVCTCAGGSWAGYYTAFCLRPGCDDVVAPDATEGDAATDTTAADTSDAQVGADAGDVPPGDVPPGDVPAEVDGLCPGDAPLGLQDGGCQTGRRCEYGQECCCGECAPALVCECFGGAWGCHNTDFCLMPNCPQDPPPEGRCRTSSDCQGGATCRDADQPSPCGICRHPEITCQADAECEEGWVCETVQPPNLCLCEVTTLCQPACGADLPCPAGRACTAGHCEPQPCTADQDCPAFFACDASTGACARQACATDADCGPGFCVNARCFSDFGDCQLPVP